MANKKPQIVIVDDDVVLLHGSARVLRNAGYEVMDAMTGTAGLELVRTACPDVMILDVVLPDIGGIELCARIKSDPRLADTHILLISGARPDENARMAGLQAGADGYLVRPLSNHALLAQVRALLRLGQVEQALRRERDFLRQVTETGPVAITVVDAEGQIVLANPRAEQVLGLERDLSQERVYNASEWKITDYDGNPFPETELPFRRVMSTGQAVYDVRHAIHHSDGTRVLLSISGAPVLDEEGKIERIVFAIADVTEQVKAIAAIEASERKFRALFDGVADAIFIHTVEGRIMEVNQAACDILGYTKEQLLATTLAELAVSGNVENFGVGNSLVGPEELPAYFRRAYEGEPVTFEMVLRCHDDTTIPVEVASGDICYEDALSRTPGLLETTGEAGASDSNGRNVILSTARDIAERKAAEARRLHEIQSLLTMSRPPMRGVTAEAFGLQPLRLGYPDLFQQWVDQYHELLGQAVERRVYRTNHDISSALRGLSEDLGRARAGPRDIVDLHVTALHDAVEGMPAPKESVYQDEGRLMMIELMGYLMSYYRQRVPERPGAMGSDHAGRI